MSTILLSTILLLFLLFLSFTSSVLSITKDDENALLKLKKQLGNGNGNPDNLQSWVEGFNFCSYNLGTNNIYIGCTSTSGLSTFDSTGRVTTLALSQLNITVAFPDAVCGLTELQVLSIEGMPGLYGPIPSCITKLSNLFNLFIEATSLSGAVPSFYNHANITYIYIRNSHLSGTIPPSLSTCTKLWWLDLSSNYLTGAIPPELVHGSFPTLYLFNNNLTGELPKCYEFVDFQQIVLRNNRLSGDASFLFGKQKKASAIYLEDNEFEFDLSHVVFSDNLQEFDLSHNKIYGKVPDSLATAARLFYHVDLSFNRLCGELPQGGNMLRFNAAVFANNTCLCGSPLPPCSISAPVPAPVSEPSF